jgi:sugar lactone lactonase YvrE
MWALLAACTPPPDTVPPDTGSTWPALPVDPACLEPPPAAPRPFEALPVLTEEDFDFDAEGRLVAQDLDALVGYTRDGALTVLSPAVEGDPAGIRVLPTGDVVVAHPALGTVSLVDGATGGVTMVLGGLQSPNGLEVGRDGAVYVSEFVRGGGVRQIDPYTGAFEILTRAGSINAIALSPDERVLYLSDWSYPTFGVVAIDRRPDGSWDDAVRTVVTDLPAVQGLSTDVCGNLYAVDYSDGGVYRIDPATGAVELLVEVGTLPTVFSSARFSPGIGDFRRTSLYVTDRTAVYEIDIALPGHHPLAPTSRR